MAVWLSKNTQKFTKMNVFIAGGTSGLGLSLAWYYYKKGHNVGICGRNIDRLEKMPFKTYQADVGNQEALANAVATFLNDQALDLLIDCAGSYAEDVVGKISYEEAEAMLKTNILGSINCLEIARQTMYPQKKGHIVMMASAIGVLDYPNSSLYAKTKRSMIAIVKAYRRALAPFGIEMSIVAPGYIKTQKLQELNDHDLSKKPFLMDEKEAVEEIVRAIEQRKAFYIFPTKMKWLMRFLSLLPPSLLNWVMYQKAQWMKPAKK